MAKKDFTKQAANASTASETYDKIMPQEVDHTQEVLEAQEEGRTQGRKGMKLKRINMAFTNPNLDFIRVMAGISGMSMGRYVNSLIEAERERNGEAYNEAKALIGRLTYNERD